MKKKNGFTLIELLAVIIILGVLMLVAIPSVTSYINNSRKSAYADTAANYIKGATNLVNEGKNIQLYETDKLFLVPAGHNKELSCVALESGGQSPYNSSYDFAYVGVTYDNSNYQYYFTAVDGSGQGFEFHSSYDISSSEKDKGSALVKAGLKTYATALKDVYASSTVVTGKKYDYCIRTLGTGDTGALNSTQCPDAKVATGDLEAMLKTAKVHKLEVYNSARCAGV